jgi:peptidoglycan hydrolase-like protein with peptidoglycan-binding domain
MLMKKIILAAVAAAALCVPAVAQQSGQTQPGSASSQAQNASSRQDISPRELSASQVQQIQKSLDDKGFKSGKVDGKWGPQTEAALKDFQRSQDRRRSGP